MEKRIPAVYLPRHRNGTVAVGENNEPIFTDVPTWEAAREKMKAENWIVTREWLPGLDGSMATVVTRPEW